MNVGVHVSVCAGWGDCADDGKQNMNAMIGTESE